MNRGGNYGFKALLVFLFLIYLTQFILHISGFNGSIMPLYLNVIIYVGLYIWYLLKYRKENLLCFELMAIPIAFLGLFFDDIIYPLSPEFSNILSVGNEAVRIKAEDIQMLAYISLLIGCSLGNDSKRNNKHNSIATLDHGWSNGVYVAVLVVVLLLLIIYDYVSGIFSSWFYYSNEEWMDVEDRNQGLGHLTCLLLATTCLEIVRLREKGINEFGSFLRHINKIYLVELVIVSTLLFISGNRNEMLLILLPVVVGYSLCIKKISNKILITAGVAGVLLMAAVGMSRQESVSLGGNSMGIYSLTRDFAGLGYNTDYLIQYTDDNGATYFRGLPSMILTGIPYVGPLILSTSGFKGPMGSATVCNDSILGTGLGTSLIGDLYYTAGLLWVIIFMLLFGYTMSRLYHSDRSINIYKLIFYSYMVANAVYYVRSSWDFPITEIEYTFIIILICNLFFKSRTIINKKK